MTQEELDAILKKHQKWLNDEDGGERADLCDADLSGADLRGADLHEANLRGADLDYSCLPLWCGSLTANFDDQHLKQIAYHLVRAGLHSKNASEETKRELAKILDFANGFHRAEECGILENPFKDGKEEK